MKTHKVTLGTEIRSLVHVVEARLRGYPDSSGEWTTIARQLRAAADKARKVARLAERMEGEAFCDSTPEGPAPQSPDGRYVDAAE